MGKSSKRTLDQATASDAAAPAAMDVDATAAAAPAVADVSPSKKSKKDKKDKSGAGADGEDKEVALEQLAEIAKPLAVKKTGKHVLRLVKKGESPRPVCGGSTRRGARTTPPDTLGGGPIVLPAAPVCSRRDAHR